MGISEELKSVIKLKDMGAIRNCQWAHIVINQTFTLGFQNAWSYCISKGLSEARLCEMHSPIR